MPFLYPVMGGEGSVSGPTAGKNDTACIVMQTGHGDPRGRRRLFFPGTPAAWVQDGVLLKPGAERLQEVARGLIVGLGAATGATDMQWMLYYPDMFVDTLSILNRVGFRYVNHLRVCLYTERMPDPPQTPFPG